MAYKDNKTATSIVYYLQEKHHGPPKDQERINKENANSKTVLETLQGKSNQ